MNFPIGAWDIQPTLEQGVGEVDFDVLVSRVGDHNVPCSRNSPMIVHG